MENEVNGTGKWMALCGALAGVAGALVIAFFAGADGATQRDVDRAESDAKEYAQRMGENCKEKHSRTGGLVAQLQDKDTANEVFHQSVKGTQEQINLRIGRLESQVGELEKKVDAMPEKVSAAVVEALNGEH